mgnify:CR=1 FL=1
MQTITFYHLFESVTKPFDSKKTLNTYITEIETEIGLVSTKEKVKAFNENGDSLTKESPLSLDTDKVFLYSDCPSKA